MVYRGGPTGDGRPTDRGTQSKAPLQTSFHLYPAPTTALSCLRTPKTWSLRHATRLDLCCGRLAYRNGSTTLRVLPGARAKGFFALTNTGSTSKLLSAAFERYSALAFPHAVEPSDSGVGGAGQIAGLDVSVESLAEDHPQLGDNESYTLEIQLTGKATLTAATVYGALHGLETSLNWFGLILLRERIHCDTHLG